MMEEEAKEESPVKMEADEGNASSTTTTKNDGENLIEDMDDDARPQAIFLHC